MRNAPMGVHVYFYFGSVATSSLCGASQVRMMIYNRHAREPATLTLCAPVGPVQASSTATLETARELPSVDGAGPRFEVRVRAVHRGVNLFGAASAGPGAV